MAVKVQFEIGHSSKLRSKRTVEGFTHDWELYVKGVQQADISTFVEKIIFHLHESFQNYNRVFKEPPYIVQESGYAGFIVFIDIYFRNRDEPKKVQYSYDLDLQHTGPPLSRSEIKTFIFDNPSEEYRQKLLKGGGVLVSGVVPGSTPTLNNNTSAMPIGATLNHSPADSHKNLPGENVGRKHKSRPDDLRSNSFANLFGTPITKTTSGVTTAHTKHSPDNKTSAVAANHQSSSGSGIPAVKEKSSKEKDKSSEKSKDRSSKKEKHHKQSLTSPHKEGRSESKKSDGSKHEKRDKNEEKPKKDKNRDKERERDRNSSANVNNSSSNSKRTSSPKPAREHSPHKTGSVNNLSAAANSNTAANAVPRPSSSNSGKLEDVKSSSKSSKDSTGESKSKDSKQKESSSSSSGKKSKKEKKDKDKERDKEKRHEEKEKLKLTENQQRSAPKEDNKVINPPTSNPNNANSAEHKNSKIVTANANAITNASHTNDANKKSDKLAKQDLFKNNEKTNISNAAAVPQVATANNTAHPALNDKKSSSSSSLNSNPNPTEKDKRSHKHKKKEKNKDKEKERERDKERDKEKDKERDKDKEREKEAKKEKESKDKHHEEKSTDVNPAAQIANATKVPTAAPPANTNEEPINNVNSSSSSTASTISNAAAIPTNTSSSSSTSTSKSSKNKEKKSKDKSSSKEEKLKHKSTEVDSGESKSKQAKLTTSNSLSASSSSSSVSTPITNSTSTLQPTTGTATAGNTENNLNLDLSDTDSLPPVSTETARKPPQLPPPAVAAHSDSSNSSFPDLPLPKQQQQQPVIKPATAQQEIAKPVAAAAPTLNSAPIKEPLKPSKSSKDKPQDKLAKEEEKEKKRRRNSVAVNTFIEPPLKQLKKETTKSVREKSKSPSLRNTGTRASISAESSATFLQPSVSPSSTAAAAPLPPPSSAPSAAHSPALSATEAVGNATSATANAATCNSNSTPSSTTNSSSVLAPHQLPLDYLSELQELHHKIMTLQDNDDLQHVVELIAATGCYEITTKTFDFDLCKLDRGTVQRLQEFFATSVS